VRFMRIGYACINQSIGCTSSSTFRLKSYSEDRLIETVQNNLKCLMKILEYNVQHDILLFRITSDLVPFASHPICTFDWQSQFKAQFRKLGKFARNNGMRLTMHPGQYTVLNSKNNRVVQNSIRELHYHTDIMNLLEMNNSGKIQIHVGGVYGDKEAALQRFITNYKSLGDSVRERLIIENDEKSYSLQDCIRISHDVGVPVVFDTLHHEVNNNCESLQSSLSLMITTWANNDGIPLVHYSSQEFGSRPGKHAELLDNTHFDNFLKESSEFDFDVMLEIKSKEIAANSAINLAKNDARFVKRNI
jgi:UV DNA damage endonuclease